MEMLTPFAALAHSGYYEAANDSGFPVSFSRKRFNPSQEELSPQSIASRLLIVTKLQTNLRRDLAQRGDEKVDVFTKVDG